MTEVKEAYKTIVTVMIDDKVRIAILLISLFVFSCKGARNDKIVRNNIAVGYKSCVTELRKQLGQQILDDHVTFLGSHPKV